MKELKKRITAFGISIAFMLSILPMTAFGAENVASVSFGETTTYYTTIDEAWTAAVALNTTEENKATVTLLADCTAAKTLSMNDENDHLILDTNGKTLTTPEGQNGIYAYDGVLEIIGNGTITGKLSNSSRSILKIYWGIVYVNGVTIQNTETKKATAVSMSGSGQFHLLDGHIISDGISDGYAIYTGDTKYSDTSKGAVYLYSGKIEGNYEYVIWACNIHFCYSDKPIYIVNNNAENNKTVIYSYDFNTDYFSKTMHLDSYNGMNIGINVEYSASPDGSNPTVVKDAGEISKKMTKNCYLKIQTFEKYTYTIKAYASSSTNAAYVTYGGAVSSNITEVKPGESVTLTATVIKDGYLFEGWYDEKGTKLCDTAEFTIENVRESKLYLAYFTSHENEPISVSFGGNITYYATIEEAWAAAVALDTTEENKATIKMLASCKATNTLTNTDDHLVLDTNGKTLTTPMNSNGITVEGGSLRIIGNGKISGYIWPDRNLAILLINGGAVYADGVTIENTGETFCNTIRINGGEFHLLDGYLITGNEYAIYAGAAGKVYLYSGKLECDGINVIYNSECDHIQICYSDKPLYIVNNQTRYNKDMISNGSGVCLADNVGMDIEYSANPDGSNVTALNNAAEISTDVNKSNYLKIQTFKTEASKFDFTSLRTLKTKNITVNHQTKTIDIEAADGAEYITILVHQKDVIPGGTFKMASYMGNRVIYDPNGSYRVCFVHNFTVPVKANITVNGVSEQYLVNVKFDDSKAKFDFTGLKGEGFGDVTVNHEDKTIHITADDSADNIVLYVNQHGTVYGGKLRMASYMGNTVSYDASGLYTIYADKNSVSVKANITINGVTEQYLITVDFPGITWGFDTVKADNIKNVSIDHENKVITLDVNDGCDNILLYIDQNCQSNIKGQIWMKSYMGNKVVYNSADRTYTITKKDKNSITVKTKITMLGETRYYDIIINFTENN